MLKSCLVCKKEFWTPSSKTKYCSRPCYYEMKRIRGDRVVWTEEMRKSVSEKMSGPNNPHYGKPSKFKGKKRPEMTGDKHPNYIRGYYISKDGYKIIGKRTKLHRKLVEDFIGRKLSSEEIIHHINGDKLDNRIENLQILNRADHVRIHREKNNVTLSR